MVEQTSYRHCCSVFRIVRTISSTINMFAKHVVLFAAFAALASAGLVRRDAPPPQTNFLDDISKRADTFAKSFTEQIQHLTQAKNTEELNKVLKENTDTILSQVSELSTSFTKALEDTSGKAKEAFKDAAEKLQKTVEDLKKQNPQVEQQAKQLAENFKQAVQKTVEETDKLAKQISTNTQELGNEVAPKLKEAYSNFITNVEVVQKKIKEAADKA